MNDHDAFHRHAPTGHVVPLVFDSPHSGTEYPEDFRPGIALAQLRKAEDGFVDELYASAPSHGAMLLAARFPRAYIDANRSFLDIDASLLDTPWPGPVQASKKTAIGWGLIWRVLDDGQPVYDRKLSVAEVMQRIARYHQPYQKAVKDALDAAHAHFGGVWHVNCHSMPAVSSKVSEEGPGKPRADFVLGDRDGTTCSPEFTAMVRDTLQSMGYEVKVNDPYKGVELVRAFSDPAANRHSLQVEVNRRLYMDEKSREKNAGFPALRANIDRLIAVLAGYAAAQGSHACASGHDHHDHHHHDHGHPHGHKH